MVSLIPFELPFENVGFSMAGDLTMISQATTRPVPSARGNELLRVHGDQARRPSWYPHLILGVCRKDVDDPVERAPGVIGMKRGEHQMTGFRGRQCVLDHFAVADLTDHDDVGVLAESCDQTLVQRVDIRAHFALCNRSFSCPGRETRSGLRSRGRAHCSFR